VSDGRVAVLASLNVDITVVAPRIPGVGETIIGSAVSTSRGGKGGNQAVALARLGVDTTVIGCVGDDDEGRSYRAALAEDGLSTDHVRSVAGEPTGRALITVDDAGNNNIVVVPGANAALDESDVDAAEPAIALSTVTLAQLEVATAATARAFAIARNAGSVTVLNPAPAGVDLVPILVNTDVVVPNEVEFVQLVGTAASDDEGMRSACERLFGLGIRWVVVTLGERGAALIGPDSFTRIPAVSVHAIDTTAAGDSFVAGVVSVLAAGGDLEEATMLAACERGARVAAWSVQRRGAQSSLPTRGDLEGEG
jgi:ribokinase